MESPVMRAIAQHEVRATMQNPHGDEMRQPNGPSFLRGRSAVDPRDVRFRQRSGMNAAKVSTSASERLRTSIVAVAIRFRGEEGTWASSWRDTTNHSQSRWLKQHKPCSNSRLCRRERASYSHLPRGGASSKKRARNDGISSVVCRGRVATCGTGCSNL